MLAGTCSAWFLLEELKEHDGAIKTLRERTPSETRVQQYFAKVWEPEGWTVAVEKKPSKTIADRPRMKMNLMRQLQAVEKRAGGGNTPSNSAALANSMRFPPWRFPR